MLRRLYFQVTVNTDNRLKSGTSMSQEFARLTEAFGYTLDDMWWFTVNATKSAFIPFEAPRGLIDEVIKPGYTTLRSLRQKAKVGMRSSLRSRSGRL
jgi:adenosine deaminase